MPAPLQNEGLNRLLQKQGLARTTDGSLYPAPLIVSAKTANYTIGLTDICGTIFTNRGAAGAVTFTLPGPTVFASGTWFDFYAIAAQNIVIATATTDTLCVVNDTAADSITISTSMQIIGAHARVFTDGTQWCFVGDTVGVTYTVAT